MRSVLLLSAISAALLGLATWVRSELHGRAALGNQPIDEEYTLFVG